MTFANPYICMNGTNTLSALAEMSGGKEFTRQVKSGGTVTAPNAEAFLPVSDDPEVKLKLVGWFLEKGEQWNMDTYQVYSNITLYPVWEEDVEDVSGGNAEGGGKKFYSVIFRGVEGDNWDDGDICVCLPAGYEGATYPMPEDDLSDFGEGYIKYYVKPYEANKRWDDFNDYLKGVIVLTTMSEEPAPT